MTNVITASGADKLQLAKSGHLIVTGPKLSCVSAGSAGGKRTAAWCSAPSVGDLSCMIVRDGYALRWDRYCEGIATGADPHLPKSGITDPLPNRACWSLCRLLSA